MINPGDKIPDNFDVARLLPPTPETFLDFELVFTELNSIAECVRVLSVEVECRDAETNNAVNISCARSHIEKAADPKYEGFTEDSLIFDGMINGVGFTLGDDKLPINEMLGEVVGKFIDEFANDLTERGDKSNAEWLREACRQKRLGGTTSTTNCVEELLDSSPLHVYNSRSYFIKQGFNDGSQIDAEWIEGDAQFLEDYSLKERLRSLTLIAQDGTEYRHTYLANGKATLLVKKPGQKIEQPAIIASDNPDFGALMYQAIAEWQEVTEQGVDTLSDGSLSDFTAALRASLDSGVAVDRQ